MENMRVDVGGVPEVENLTLSSSSRRVALLGGGRALEGAVAGAHAPVRGTITIDGEDPRALLASGSLAGASIDAALPPKWTALEYATWSGRLAGAPELEARKAAADALAALGPGPAASLGKAPLEAQRAAIVAGLFATGARVLVLRDPTEGMRPESARAFARALCKLLGERAFVLFADALPLASPFALHTEDAIVLRGSRVVAQGAPAEVAAMERSFTVRATGNVAAFAKLVEDAGGRVTPEASEHMAIDLGAELKVRDLFALAADAQAVVVEVLPLGRAFT